MRTKRIVQLCWIGLLIPFLAMCQTPTAPDESKLPDYKPNYPFAIKKVKLANHLEIAYTEKGNPKHKTLILVHGLGGSMAHWQQNLDSLSMHYRCIALDLPVYGASAKNIPEPKTDYLEFFANTILELADKLKIKSFVLVGHSMGGQTAIITALKSPQKVEKLILVAPAGLETFHAMAGNMMKQLATTDFFYKQTEDQIRNSLKNNFLKMPAEAEQLAKDRIAFSQSKGFYRYCQVVEGGVRGMLDHPVSDQLSAIQQPTLIIFGKNDMLIPNKLINKDLTTEAVGKIGKEKIKNSQLVMIDEAGHLVQFEKPRELNKAILAFLQN